MTSMTWYKRNPDKALTGMMELTLEERGAFNTILDLIYAKGGKLLDNNEFICSWLSCDIRVWRRIKKRLIDLEKIYTDGEFIRNSHADRLLLRANSRANTSAQVPDKLPPKSEAVLLDNNDLAENTPQKTPDRIKNTESKKESKKERPCEDLDDEAIRKSYWFGGYIIRLNERDYNSWLEAYGGTDEQFMKFLDDRDDWYRKQAPERQKNWFLATKKYIENLKGRP